MPSKPLLRWCLVALQSVVIRRCRPWLEVRPLLHPLLDAVPGDVAKGTSLLDDPPLVGVVEVRAVDPALAAVHLLARFGLVVQWVVLALLPAMTFSTRRVVRAAIKIIHDEIGALPVRAGDRLVGEYVWLAAVVLPVVGVDARRLIVFREIERTPLGFEVEDVEVLIALQQMDQLNRDIRFAVREAAEGSVLTFIEVVRVE